MFHMTLILADVFIVAQDHEGTGEWDVQIQDCLTGKFQKAKWNQQQLADVVALAICDDDHINTVELYARVEPLIEDWDKAVRPMP